MEFKRDWLRSFWESVGREPNRHIPPDLRKPLFRKLQILDAAVCEQDLWVPPSNRYERLRGGLEGRSSIRVNDQYRLCFVWSRTERQAKEVDFCDYHR